MVSNAQTETITEKSRTLLNSVLALKEKISQTKNYFEFDEENGIYLFRLQNIDITDRQWSQKLFSSLFHVSEVLTNILNNNFRVTKNTYDIVVLKNDSDILSSKNVSEIQTITGSVKLTQLNHEAIILLFHFLSLPENKEIDLDHVSVVVNLFPKSNLCHKIICAFFSKNKPGKSFAFSILDLLGPYNWHNYANLAFMCEE